MPDLAVLVARFGERLRAAGLPVGPDRCERFARAITIARPATLPQLRWCARTTLAASPAQVAVLDSVFDSVFAGLADPASYRGEGPSALQSGGRSPGLSSAPAEASSGRGDREIDQPALASAVERFGERDFAELSTEELLVLADVMSRLVIATPKRRSRRLRPPSAGGRIDLRSTLRQAHRTGGDPVRLLRREPRQKPRRLIALCDISGSMAPYARAMIQLLYCAAGGERAEVFTFATRLTRITPVLRRATPAAALTRAGRAAPDWSGGTRIGAGLKQFLDEYGRAGLARGAIVLIISDGWETEDVAQLGRQMARLSRLAYRIIWVNPRTQSARYRPLVAGMATAWPHCDAVVSAHRLTALDELLAALADPLRRRRQPSREE